jgi:hypothetical protein
VTTWPIAATVLAHAIAISSGAPTSAQRIPVPATDGSGMYSLASAADGRVYLSWVESVADGFALRISALAGARWTEPRTITTGQSWFVNWEDHPSISVLRDGSLLAHWLVTNDGKTGSYNYGVHLARSDDGGATWREVASIGTDRVLGYTGFVSIASGPSEFDIVYLTPPTPTGRPDAGDLRAGHAHTMTLAHARFGLDGRQRSSEVIDLDACTCCTTAAARTDEGVVVAYRDHEQGELRDISIVRDESGTWTAPESVHRDGWRFNGCPTNGPALAARGNHVAVAWFTAAGDVPRLKLAFSDDGGRRFAAPLTIDDGKPTGWPGIVALDDGSVVVSWLVGGGGGMGELRLRRVRASGAMSASMTIATAHASGIQTGVPQMVRSGDSLVIAWREGRVRTALVPIPPL